MSSGQQVELTNHIGHCISAQQARRICRACKLLLVDYLLSLLFLFVLVARRDGFEGLGVGLVYEHCAVEMVGFVLKNSR